MVFQQELWHIEHYGHTSKIIERGRSPERNSSWFQDKPETPGHYGRKETHVPLCKCDGVRFLERCC